jgi:maltooligosyltrehalose trehalohydrolase
MTTAGQRVDIGRVERRNSVGPEWVRDGVSFRVFADQCKVVHLCIEGEPEREMTAEGNGYFALHVPGLPAGALYRYRLDGEGPYPDPASRAQPRGPHGPSQVVASARFAWTDQDWKGCKIEGQVVYEMHVGTFTPEGTWRAAIAKLEHLRQVGITLIEMMPVAAFPGRFGWGYDGVALFAPAELYGTPEDLRAFIDAAHGHGIGVILDVVYNHFGPDGNYLAKYSGRYFTDRYENEWGASLNFDDPKGAPVRDLVVENARYWIEEFHFDGLRLDATQSIFDSSHEHVVAELTRVCRAAAAPRDIVVVGENEPEDSRLMRPPSEGGYGLDALWNDDFHHSAVVALTGRNGAYYEDHLGSPQEFISAAKHGFLFQGQVYFHQSARRGRPALDRPPHSFVLFTENHDQVANSATGRRLHQLTSPGRARAMAGLLLMMPGTPMLFQGQEFNSSAPFYYFADHSGDLAKMVASGRELFLDQFESLATQEMHGRVPPPHAIETFEACKLDWAEIKRHAGTVALHRDLLRLRREDDVLSGRSRQGLDGSVIGDEAFLLRFFGPDGDDRLLLANFGRDLIRRSIPDPLVAPPARRRWKLLWSSEHPEYGGGGTAPVERKEGWFLPGQSVVVLKASDEDPPQ